MRINNAKLQYLEPFNSVQINDLWTIELLMQDTII